MKNKTFSLEQLANRGTFRNRSFWETTLGFSSAVWDFSLVSIRGYPRLRECFSTSSTPRRGSDFNEQGAMKN